MPRLCFVADVINHYEEFIQSYVNQCQQCWKSLLQRLLFVLKFIAERGLAFRDNENVGSPKKLFQAKFQKGKYDASVDRVCNSFTNR